MDFLITVYVNIIMVFFILGDKFSYPSEPTSSRSSHNGIASNANNGIQARGLPQYYADEKNSDNGRYSDMQCAHTHMHMS
jgi:hypothetical protein